MRNNLIFGKGMYALFLCAAFFLYNCSHDNNSIGAEQTTNVTFNLGYPEGVENGSKAKFNLTLKEKNSGIEYKFEKETAKNITKTVLSGNYQINVDGYIIVDRDTLDVYGLVENTQITSANSNQSVPLKLKGGNKEGDFVIQEIFFTGLVYPVSGKPYNSGKYFKIYNNSNRTLYADGLLICQSQFNTITKMDISPNIFNTAFPVEAILMLPGKGKDYPVKPGQSIVVCDNAINHKAVNANAYDMSPAAIIGKEGTQYLFEYPNTENAILGQVDNPQVPNAQVIFTTLKYNMFIMHNGGAESYAIARLGKEVTKEQYLNQYKYDYSFVNINGNAVHRSVYKIPNEWIADAVTVSIESEHEWLVISPDLDKSWTYCSLQFGDKTRYDKCVRRKVKGKNNKGIDILQDTNDSREDFIPRAPLFLSK